MKHEDAEVLVTGATGFIGRWLLAALTARGRTVAAVLRNAAARDSELRSFVDGIGGDSRRLVVVPGDVESPSLGLDDGWESLRDVYHLAARYEFGMSMADARRTNVNGTLNALAWASGQPSLRRFIYLGGYRMTRPTPELQAATFPLSDAEAAQLYREHGAYEASKHESWMAFRHTVASLDIAWTAVHPSSAIGDSTSGKTTQVTGLGETVERLWKRDMPALVGTKRTFLPVVAVDYLASFLASVPDNPETVGQELTVLDQQTPELPELVREIAEHLRVDAPSLVLPVSLVRALPRAWTGIEPETLGFLSDDRYDTDAADAHARVAGLQLPDRRRSLARWCDHLVSTRFGADPSADAGSMREGVFAVGDPRTAPVVYLHGLPWNGDVWKPVDELVTAEGARLDLPGLGRSAPSSLSDAAWLDSVLRERERCVVLVGHSVGAAMAVRYAHAHPDKVGCLVLVSPSFLQRPPSKSLRVSPLVAHSLSHATPEALVARLVPELGLAGEVPPSVASASLDLARKGVARRVAASLSRAGCPRVRADLQRQLSDLHCPVILVHGENDPILVPHRVGPERVWSLSGAGHNPQLTRTEAVAKIVSSACEMPRCGQSLGRRHADSEGTAARASARL